MIKKIFSFLVFIFFLTTANSSLFAQCNAYTNNTACTQNSPVTLGNTISCTPPANNRGRRNFLVTNMIAGATYRISNCGSGFDTQITIRDNATLNVVGFADDDGPDCLGLQASIDFIPPTTGDYRIQLNRYDCLGGNSSLLNGDINVTLLANAPTPPVNDLCSTATPIGCDATILNQTTISSSNTPHNTPCSLSNYGVWYTFVGNGDQTTIITTSDIGFDHEMAIMSTNSDCNGTFTLVTCEDDNLDGNIESFTFDTVNGTTYYVYVADYFSGASSFYTGNFSISRTCVSSCTPSTANGTSTLACPSVIAAQVSTGNSPVILNYCTTNNVQLEATYLDIGTTDSYDVDDISGTTEPFQYGCLANQVSLDLDDVWSDVETFTGFDFCFYGETYSDFIIGSNGVISFDTSLALGPTGWEINNNLPSTANASNYTILGTRIDYNFGPSIHGAHNDIDPRFGGEVGWQIIDLDTGCKALVVAWNEVPLFLNANIGDLSKRYTSMIVLYENTNVIEVYIKEKVLDDIIPSTVDIWNNGRAVIGLQDENSTAATLAPNRNATDANWTVNPPNTEAWRFTPSSGSLTSLIWYQGSAIANGGATTIADGGTINLPSLGTNDIITVSPTTTTIYTAAVTYTFCDGSTDIIYDEVTVDVTGKIWIGGDDTVGPNTNPVDWMNPENWLGNSIPTITDCIIIRNTANNPILYGADNGEGLNLTIEIGATLTLDDNTVDTNYATVTIQEFVNTQGSFTINNSSSLIQIDDGAVNTNNNSGSITMNRIADVNLNDYVYWSSPVVPNGTNGTNNIEDILSTTPNGYKYRWSPTVIRAPGPFGPLDFGEWDSFNSGPMAIGKGYIAIVPNPLPVPYNISFSGKPNNGWITQSIERGTYDGNDYTYQPISGGEILTVTKQDDNWNLIGNPYPSAISADDFIIENATVLQDTINPSAPPAMITGTIHLWRHLNDYNNSVSSPFYEQFQYNYNSNDYINYNLTGSNPSGFNGFIGAGQGFFIQMEHTTTNTTEDVTFRNSMRNSGYQNSQFYRNAENSTTEIERHRLWLDLIAPNNEANSILIGYIEDATNNIDRLFDGHLFGGLQISFYSLINEEKFTIQGKSLPFEDVDIVPLGLVVPNNGNYTIAINTVDGLFDGDNGQNIYLEDTYLGIIHDLRINPYSFNTDEGTFDDRFVLRYNNEALNINEFENNSDLIIYIEYKLVKLKSEINTIESVIVYNVLGQTLISVDSIDNLTHTLYNLKPSDGVLFVKATLSDGRIKIQKIIY